MAIAYRSQTDYSSGGTSVTTFVMARPAGTVAGDLMVLAVDHLSGSTTCTSPGWESLYDVSNTAGGATSHSTNALYKIAGAAEPADYTITLSSSKTAIASMLTYSGALATMVTADIVSASVVDSAATTTVVTAPGVTTTVDGCLLLTIHHVGVNVDANTWTPPTGMTERADIASGGTSGSSALSVNELILGAAGATGDKTATASLAGYPTAITLTFPPGAGGEPPAPAQTAAPVSDASAGTWTTDTGAATGLYAAIDEAAASDADYIQSQLAPTGANPAEVMLGSLSAPDTGTRSIRVRRAKGVGTARVDLTTALVRGGTVVQSFTEADIGAAYSTTTHTLTSDPAAWTDLRLRFTATQVAVPATAPS
ncbi:MAG: hypothetical protein M3440_07355, partial [Chloroflexota bacterium]|nr:hypothetical protein [Chloroflexota bacterium]